MKRFLLLFAAILGFMLFNPFVEDAYAFQKSGKQDGHNYVQIHRWTFDSLKVGSSDSVILLKDSTSSAYFSTASLGKIRNEQPDGYARMPDSMQTYITWAGESDAVSIRYSLYVRTGASNPWVAQGTPDTISMTGATRATAVISQPIARPFYPGSEYRMEIKVTTSTDTARIYDVINAPKYR